MNQSGNRFKKVVYNYDLISGKVNQVSYQPGQADAYYHRYSYDAENRLTDVYTGRDSTILLLFPEKEAHYSYYKHGPLMRTVLGQLQVQGLDYAYTLQGWLKGINPVMGGTLTNGTDTTEAFPVTQDVYGFSLNYYNKDYRAIGYSPSSTTVLGALTTNAAPLYNGNIGAMAVNIPQLSATKVYNYHYDQLNRIVSMDMYNGLNPNAGTFTPASDTSYKERVSYDPNGNILGYLRNGDAGNTMDSLNYKYYTNTNQLSQVRDNVSATKYTTDIDNQAANNYTYDAIGNMTSDASDTITNVTWNVYGKIMSVTKNGRAIKYIYDASGNRVMKYTNADTTAYVRDATGNVMSVYYKPAGGSLVQSEMHLYGSSRLGMATQHTAKDTSFILIGGFGNITGSIFTRGEKLFELSNHLGNVLATVTDRRIQVDANSDGTVDSYKADMVSANDYYPFGMLMPGRSYFIANTNYRYGFNGKERETDPVQYDYGFRIYDPRLERFKSVDPLASKFAMLTPYQFASNRPIDGIDLDGLEYATFTIVVDGNTGRTTKISVSKDYELKNKNSRGPGIQYNVVTSSGVEVTRYMIKNLYGIYQGGSNPQLPKIGENYTILQDDYSLEPIDETDANAKHHDRDYDKKRIAGLPGILSKKSSEANENYIKRADKTIDKYKKKEKDDITGKPVTKEAKEAAEFGKKWFKIAEDLKKPVDPKNEHPVKISNPNDPSNGGIM